jgi:hypothetical protein
MQENPIITALRKKRADGSDYYSPDELLDIAPLIIFLLRSSVQEMKPHELALFLTFAAKLDLSASSTPDDVIKAMEGYYQAHPVRKELITDIAHAAQAAAQQGEIDPASLGKKFSRLLGTSPEPAAGSKKTAKKSPKSVKAGPTARHALKRKKSAPKF